jgi:hypothetical protein
LTTSVNIVKDRIEVSVDLLLNPVSYFSR